MSCGDRKFLKWYFVNCLYKKKKENKENKEK